MTYVKYIFFSLTIFLFAGCSQKNSPKATYTIDRSQLINYTDTSPQKSGEVYWLTPHEITPISFLNSVVLQNDKDTFINVITLVDEFPVDWVKPSDLDSLISLIASTKKCNCIINPLSSYIPTNMNADIGGYALLFINSFRQKSKIDFGQYSCPKTDEQSVEAINKWWIEYKQTR